jgi:hypothetical protein
LFGPAGKTLVFSEKLSQGKILTKPYNKVLIIDILHGFDYFFLIKETIGYPLSGTQLFSLIKQSNEKKYCKGLHFKFAKFKMCF